MKKIIPFALKKAIAAEEDARNQLEAVQAVREKAEAIQNEWETLSIEYERCQVKVNSALDIIEDLRARGLAAEELAISRLGHDYGPIQSVTDIAVESAKAKLALPILELGLKRRREELSAHARKMREFGEKNDIPREAFKDLPKD